MNREAHCDINWWLQFLPSWNGRAIIPEPNWTKSPDLELFTDASESLGYGIFYIGHWISDPWPSQLQGPIDSSGKSSTPSPSHAFSGDTSGLERSSSFTATTKQWPISGLLGPPETPLSCILSAPNFFSAANYHYTVLVTHIAGINNSIADSLYRLQITQIRRLAPTADIQPTPVPKSAVTLWYID